MDRPGLSAVALVASVTALTALAATARAQSTVDAEKLFRDGKGLMKQRKVAEACDAFEASQRIESNIATLMSLADCREKNGQLASAWGHFLRAESMTRSDPSKTAVNTIARRRAAAIEPRMSYLIVNVPDESRVEGLVVSRNHVVIDPGTWNRALPVDGGEYLIEGRAPGHEPWSTTIVVRTEGDRQSVEVPKFKELPKLMEQIEKSSRTDEDGDVGEPAPSSSTWTPQRKIALGIGIGSAVALVGGAALGMAARGADADAKDACPRDACSAEDAQEANDRRDRANDLALGANIAFGVSAAAAIGAGVLWYLGGGSAGAGDGEEPASGEISLRPNVGAFTGVVLDARF